MDLVSFQLLTDLYCYNMKGSTRERQQPDVKRKILSDCAGMQLFFLYCPRLPVHDYRNHFMDLLALPQVDNSTTNRVGHARTWYRFPYLRLVCHSLVSRQPSDQSILCHCQYHCWLYAHHVCGITNCLLGIQLVQCQKLRDFL